MKTHRRLLAVCAAGQGFNDVMVFVWLVFPSSFPPQLSISTSRWAGWQVGGGVLFLLVLGSDVMIYRLSLTWGGGKAGVLVTWCGAPSFPVSFFG